MSRGPIRQEVSPHLYPSFPRREHLHPRRSTTVHRGRVPDVLVVAAAVRVLNLVHRDTTDLVRAW